MLEANSLPVERLVTIKPSLARPLDPAIELSTDSDYLSGHLGKQELPERYELRLKLSSQAPIGPIQGNIFLKASSVTNHIFQIAVGGKVIGDLRAEPETLYFGTIPQGREQTLRGKIFAVRPDGKYGISILPASASRFIAGRMTDRATFEVLILSNAPPGRVNATARIASPKDKNAVVEAPIFAFVSTNVSTRAQGAGPAANH
ncbi:MAG: hypothetical protein HY360_22560 [Verrucomicrobia bacterium]|nr:hypothetical protein [Verrucomicrobiota bacterium]